MKQDKNEALKLAFISGITLFFGFLLQFNETFIFAKPACYIFFSASLIAALLTVIYAMPDSPKE